MNQSMKAVIAYARNRYALEERPIPDLRDGDMLIKVEACGICAGDIKAYDGVSRFWSGDGMPAYAEPPFTPGHEFFGRVVAIQGMFPAISISATG